MLGNLNNQQRKAVETVDGRVLVLAGAGTGKTLVLTTRIAHLIQTHRVDPKNILGLTFTNKAANEMRHRLGKILEAKEAKEVTLCTFHSFCMAVLREDIHHLGYTNQFTLYAPGDIEHLVKDIARDIIGRENELPSLGPTMRLINQARQNGLKPEEVTDLNSEWHQGFVKDVYTRLLENMRAHNAIDFDHLLYLTVELFDNHPSILQKYQLRYRYVLIDEYQDTNHIQFLITSKLTAIHRNLCVVGDDDQSIYGWRGACINNILEFDQAKIIKLEQNYRSTPNILKAANGLIHKNTKRHGKSLWSSKGEHEPIHLFTAPTEKGEAEAIICRMKAIKERRGCPWKDFAILYRSNALSRTLEQELIRASWNHNGEWKRGIPYQIFGGLEFMERSEVKDMIAYLRVVANPFDQTAILRIINQPRRGVGDGSLSSLTEHNRKESIPLWRLLQDVAKGAYKSESISSKALQGIKHFVELIENAQKKFQSEPLAECMKWLIDACNYKRAIQEDVESEKMRVFKWENVQEVVSTISSYEQECQSEGKTASLIDFITSTALDQERGIHAQKGNEKDQVQLMTFHSAKGLEFPVCFLVGIEDRIIPHEKSLLETGEEEERRLLYVAMTRAKERLFMSMSKMRMVMGQQQASRPSRFLHDIPKELFKIVSWDDPLA